MSKGVSVFYVADDASEANAEDGTRIEAVNHEDAVETFLGNCYWEYESNSGIVVFVCKHGSGDVRRFDCEIEYEASFYCRDVTRDADQTS